MTKTGSSAGAARDTQTLCGARAVLAALRQRPADQWLRVFYSADHAPPHSELLREHLRAAARARVPYRQVADAELERICGSRAHQGLVAVFRPPAVPKADLAKLRLLGQQATVLVLLDGVGNPHNLGAIARTAAYLGAAGVVVEHGQAQAMRSAATYRTAEGGLETLAVWHVDGLVAAIGVLRQAGAEVVALDVRDAQPLTAWTATTRAAVVWVAGAEENGLRPEVRAACTRAVCIEGSGAVESLNVGAALAIALARSLNRS